MVSLRNDVPTELHSERRGVLNRDSSLLRRFRKFLYGKVNICETVCSEKGVALEGLADGYRGTEQLNG